MEEAIIISWPNDFEDAEKLKNMKTMTVGKFKSHFSDVVDQVKAGASFAVTYGRKKEIVGYFLPEGCA